MRVHAVAFWSKIGQLMVSAELQIQLRRNSALEKELGE